MALVPAVLTLNVSPCSFSVAVDSFSLDYHLEKRISWWSRLAEVRYQAPVESDRGPVGAQPTPVSDA
ncbi:MAG: hypothetical protein M0008_08140 [Actinomycetota bacterium]|nr:hypothetical protein [Actinomycetota bacterium]